MSVVVSQGKKDRTNIAQSFKKPEKNNKRPKIEDHSHSPVARTAQQAFLDEEKNNMRNG